RLSGFALADARHFRGMPGVQLGLAIDRFALAALRGNACGLVQGLFECLAYRLTDGAGFAIYLTAQPRDDRALALDAAAHAFELAGMCIAPGLAAKLLALLGEGLLQIDASVLGCLDQFG